MKKIYVYVGQLRSWMLRMTQSVRKCFWGGVMENVTFPIGYSPHFKGEAGCGGQETTYPSRSAEGNQLIPNEAEAKETLLVRAERYLWERYEFRYNVLAKCYEFKLKMENLMCWTMSNAATS